LEDPPSQRNKHNLEMRNLLPRNLWARTTH
jgi:hypothetical protein